MSKTIIFKNMVYIADMKDINTSEIIGKNIALHRKALGLTQERLAERIGIIQPTLASYEVGRRTVPVSLIPSLARALDTTAEEILGISSPKGKRKGPLSKLDMQIEQIKFLPRSNQKFVSTFLDQVLASKKIAKTG